MTNLAIYLRLVFYPLLALGLFMLSTCCHGDRRMQRTIYLLFSALSMLQFFKAFQQVSQPTEPHPLVEWGLVVLIAITAGVVWAEFFRERKDIV